MKKSLLYLSTMALLAVSYTDVNAQIFFTEDFEGAVGANGLPAGLTETGLSTDGIWTTGDAAVASSAYITVPAAIQGTNFAYTNDDDCNCDKSADRLILPSQDLSGMVAARVYFDVYLPGDYGGIGTVEASTDNGATWTVISTIATNAAWQDDVMVNLSAYVGAGNTNVMISFLYNDDNAWADAMAIDDIKLEELTSTSPDMELTNAIGSEYTIVPFSQIAPINLSADVTNTGTVDATDATLTVNVYDIANLTTPIQTTSSPATVVNASASANLSASTFTPTGITSYVFEYITTATGDASAANDTMYNSVTIDANVYGRDDGNVTASFGIGAGPTGYLGYKFEILATTPIDSVFGAFNKPGSDAITGDGVGDVTRFVIYDEAAGLPNTIIGASSLYTFTAADTLGLITRTLEIQSTGGGTLTLNPGTYFVMAEENNTNLGLAFSDNNFQTNTFYFSWTGQPWTAAETFPANFHKAPVLRPILGCALTATPSTTDETCSATDGSAMVTANGVAPYTYLWSNGATTSSITGVSAGTYTVTVTDNSGCEVIETITVNSNNIAVTSNSTTSDASCGATDGTATATPTNGTAPYSYLWSDGQTTQTATNLSAGSYNVTITDANGCSGVTSGIVVSNPNSPTLTSMVTSNYNGAEISCNGATDGEATANSTGGTAPYSYSWDNGQTTAIATGLSAGTYVVTVTDAASCSSVSSVTVTEPALITSTNVVTEVSCNGATDGAIDLTVTGGTGSYTYLWSNAATTEDITGLAAGTYSPTVTDANGCDHTTSISVIEPAALSLTEVTTNVTNAGGSDGSIDLTVTGGTATYTYAWSNGATTEDVTGLAAGTYTCTVTDANGCSEVISATVLDGVASLTDLDLGIGSIKLFPNPANNQVNLTFDLTETTGINMEVVNSNGQVLRTINNIEVFNNNYVLDISNWSTGVYFVKVQTTTGAGVIRFVKQ